MGWCLDSWPKSCLDTPFLLSPSDQSRAGVLDADQPGLVTALVWVQVMPHCFGGYGNHKHDSLGPGSWPRRIQHPPIMWDPPVWLPVIENQTLAPLVGSVITIFKMSHTGPETGKRLPGPSTLPAPQPAYKITQRSHAPINKSKLTRRECRG